MKAKALWHIDPDHSKIRSKKNPSLKDGEVLIQSLYSLISLGTERLVSTGKVPESLHESMKVPYMGGKFNFPVKYGYSLVGKIASENHPDFGKVVHVMHPHQDKCIVREEDLFFVPEGIPAARATLAANLETAINAVWDSGVSVGDRALVVGFGLVGSLVARVISLMPATEVVVVDVSKEKLKLAAEMGFQTAGPEDIKGFFDFSFHTSGSSAGLQTCIDKTGFEGKIIELSWYGTKKVSVNFGGSFHSERKSIISSQVSQLPADRRGRWDFRRRKEGVFKLLKNPVFDDHLGIGIAFEKVPTTFSRIRKGKELFSIFIDYGHS